MASIPTLEDTDRDDHQTQGVARALPAERDRSACRQALHTGNVVAFRARATLRRKSVPTSWCCSFRPCSREWQDMARQKSAPAPRALPDSRKLLAVICRQLVNPLPKRPHVPGERFVHHCCRLYLDPFRNRVPGTPVHRRPPGNAHPTQMPIQGPTGYADISIPVPPSLPPDSGSDPISALDSSLPSIRLATHSQHSSVIFRGNPEAS